MYRSHRVNPAADFYGQIRLLYRHGVRLKWRLTLIIYGCMNAFLYASLLPLWEGFDEPFHYGYVQELSMNRRLPQLGQVLLSQEICRSLELAPSSHAVKQNLPFVTTFDVHFHMMAEERNRRRSELSTLVSHEPQGTCAYNYEAHQAPLAYALLAPVDGLLRQSNLLTRVWLLRLLCAILSCIGTTVALFLLEKRLHLAEAVGNTVVFVVLSSQMFYATTAHIANDWLAVPLTIFVFERLIALWENAGSRNMVALGASLGAGLLTKSYFLALVPFAVAVAGMSVAWRHMPLRALMAFWFIVAALAGPWYLRNILLYQNVSGMQETTGGVHLSALIASATEVPWIRSGRELLFSSLWTGNNSFNTFSRWTLTLLLVGYCAGAASRMYCSANRKLSVGERILLYGCITYGIALAYSAAVSFWSSGGTAFSPSPWYAQPIMPLVSTLLFCGLRCAKRLHGIIAIWIIVLSAYIICVTYWAKLIPLYSGYPEGKSTLRGLISWYADSGAVVEGLSVTAIGVPVWVLGLSAGVVFLALALVVGLSRQWIRLTVSDGSKAGGSVAYSVTS